MKRRAALAGTLAGLAGLAGCAPSSSPPRARPKLPTLEVRDLTGAPRTVVGAAGHAQVINMWALWCPPCRAELPALQRLAQALAPQGIAVSAIALAADLFPVREYLAQVAALLPGAVLAPSAPVVRQLELDRLPQTFLVDAQGGVIAAWIGARDWDAPAVRAELLHSLRS